MRMRRGQCGFKFQRRSFEQHAILDVDGYVVGHLRVTPTAIWWKSGGRASWFGLDLLRFAHYVKRAGVRKRRRRRVSRAP
jgi:hypothetical protein